MSINNELHRNINTGSQFDKYFEKVECKATFEKNGDTTDVLHVMHKNAIKYASQTKAIAQQLKGSTVKQTVDNIYNFLYNNVQYQIDGYNQNLRSPACSWQQRTTGIDCKSYAIFASTILLNLGIEHYFRKVKQKWYSPNYWTHVYVVIKDSGKELIIDPTIHSNNEVDFVQKKDIKVSKLPIYSLNAGVQEAPAQNGDTEILNGFFQVSDFLKQIGVPQSTIETIETLVQSAYYKYGSFDFPFKLLPNDILFIDGVNVPLKPKGLNGAVDAAATAMLTDPSGITSALTLLSTLNIQENISNVLKYGLSSWGATTSPEGIQVNIDELGAYVKNVLSQNNIGQAVTTFNKTLKRLLTYYTHIRANHAKATSTQKAYDAMINALNEFLKLESEINTKLNNAGYIFSVKEDIALGVENIFTATTGHVVGTDAHNKSTPFRTPYNVYTITYAPQQPIQIIDQPVNQTTTYNGQVPQQNTTQYPQSNQQVITYDAQGNPLPTANSNVGKIIGIGTAIALAGFLVVPMMNKNKGLAGGKTKKRIAKPKKRITKSSSVKTKKK